MNTKPKGYEDDLGPFGPVFFDACCGEPVGWGFRITRHLSEDRFNALREFGELKCSPGRWGKGSWFLIIDRLTPAKAKAKYGEVTELNLGPRGGFQSVKYGTTMFFSRDVDPRKEAA